MTAQESAKPKSPDTEISGQDSVTAAEAPGAEAMSLEELGLSTRVVNVLRDAGLETAQDILDRLSQGEGKILAIPGIADKTLEEIRHQLAQKGFLEFAKEEVAVEKEPATKDELNQIMPEAQEAAPTPQAQIEQNSQAGLKPEESEAGKALAETESIAVQIPENIGTELVEAEENGAEQRISFVVRLTIDKQSQPRRTEIEHARSGKKQTFPGLDMPRLKDFMEACIIPPASSEPALTSAPLLISQVRVSRPEEPDSAVLALNSDEAFIVRAHFRLQGADASLVVAQKSAFEVKVYAREVTSGKSILLARYEANLAEDVLEYMPQMQVSGLSSGLYHLVTLVTLYTSLKIGGYYEGPLFQVTEVQPAMSPVLAMGIAASR